MRWNKSANADRQALIAAAMGHPGKDAGDVLDDFIRGLGMPRSLGEVKVGREHFERIASQAMGTPWVVIDEGVIDGSLGDARARANTMLPVVDAWMR